MDVNAIENEVFQDFKSSLEKINFQAYSPTSVDFINALFTGVMWKLIKQLESDEPEEVINEDSKKEYESEEIEQDEISEEISGAKKYFQKYTDSGDELFKSMAQDEIRHAEILIKKAYSRLPNATEKSKLKGYEEQLKDISEQM